MTEHHWTRRDFLRAGAVATAGIVAFPAIPTVYAGNPEARKTSEILNYNEQMEYRRAGKTGLMVSAVCMGGHWKRIDKVIGGTSAGSGWSDEHQGRSGFDQNRYDVVTRCMERGINYIDACTSQEVRAYAKALRGRRDRMYLGYSWYQDEMRSLSQTLHEAEKEGKPYPAGWITQKLKESLDNGFKQTGLDYIDVWRITLDENSSRHSDDQMEEMLAALDWAKTSGRARFTGISSHDRPHIKTWIEKAPDQLEVVCTPYTAKTRLTGASIEVSPEGNSTRVVTIGDGSWETSLWAAMQRLDIAWFGIKPFASNSMFNGDSSPDSPHAAEDNKIARLTIRAILSNPVITAPIPGLITPEQVDNVCIAVMQRRALDVKEQAELEAATEHAFANLPPHYEWLNDWNYV